MPHGKAGPGRRGDGFTYVAVLFALAIFGVGLAAIGESWSAAAYREREDALLRVGAAYQRAISRYYRQSPGAVKSYPYRLSDLTEDPRMVGVVRHLRAVYPDPISGTLDWGVIAAPGGGIAGVYSKSEKVPLRKVPTSALTAVVTGSRYADWKFVSTERD